MTQSSESRATNERALKVDELGSRDSEQIYHLIVTGIQSALGGYQLGIHQSNFSGSDTNIRDLGID